MGFVRKSPLQTAFPKPGSLLLAHEYITRTPYPFEHGKATEHRGHRTLQAFPSNLTILDSPTVSHPTPRRSDTAAIIMDKTKHPNQVRSPSPTSMSSHLTDHPPPQASKPAPTSQKPKATDKPSPKSISSTRTIRGSLTSSSAGNSNGGANSANTQRGASTLQHWLQQTPRDDPWKPGSRSA